MSTLERVFIGRKMGADWVALLLTVKAYLRGLFVGDSSRSILPFVPRPLRFLALLVLILNTRSLPFIWHREDTIRFNRALPVSNSVLSPRFQTCSVRSR